MPEEIEGLPRLYRDLASWWPVLSAPEDYAEEAAFYQNLLVCSCHEVPRTLLELGSGGGNNASHLKKHFQMTLVDLAPGMLEVSRALNPECEHIQGDMRSIRLGRLFDTVFIQDAIGYMASEADLRSALQTAYLHCRPGGAAVFAPDFTRENFKPSTGHGGHDRGVRAMRYLDWSMDPDPTDSTYLYVMVYLLREGADQLECVLDKHVCGLFSRAEWLQWITEAGFEAKSVPFVHSEIEPGACEVFIGYKPLTDKG
jgi:ubiquinone/menaquinone biosynthesis C-methylase UbiE